MLLTEIAQKAIKFVRPKPGEEFDEELEHDKESPFLSDWVRSGLQKLAKKENFLHNNEL